LVDNGRAKLHKITKGIESEGSVEIKAGLKSGQLILSKPDNTVKEGMKIKIPAGLKTKM
jgi:HlyD family secretion protein